MEELLEMRFGLACAPWQRERLSSWLEHRGGGASPRVDDLLKGVIERLTVGETYFFREASHFDALALLAVPERAAVRGGRAPIRILSVGCASGEEAYSIAITLEDRGLCARHGEFAIEGIDVNAEAIQSARRARFAAWSLRTTADDRRRRFFRREGDWFHLADSIAARVGFEERNVFGDAPLSAKPGEVDVVFCRNVLIYFSDRAASAAIERFAHELAPGGFLFLGHSETLRRMPSSFERIEARGAIFYRRVSARPLSFSGAAEHRLPMGSDWEKRIQDACARVDTIANPLTRPDTEERPPRGLGAPIFELVAAERFDDVLATLAALPQSAQAEPEAELIRAVIAAGQGRFGEAEDACARLLQVGGHAAGALFLLGLCREHEGDGSSAAAHYREALRMDPSFAIARLHLGMLERRHGGRDVARSELALALEGLAKERVERVALFGGGLRCDALLDLCRSELAALERDSA